MTPARANELLPIITAFAAGKQVQVKVLSSWLNIDHPAWDEKCEYRIKPDPRWYRVGLHTNGHVVLCTAEGSERAIQDSCRFDRWLTDRVEYDV